MISRKDELDPRGEIHLPIGIADTRDTLKTIVEPEGCFSPGVGSYGIYLWLYDREARRLYAATLDGVRHERGLAPEGVLLPWSEWNAGPARVRMELCETRNDSPEGAVFVTGLRVTVSRRPDAPMGNRASAPAARSSADASNADPAAVSLLVALRSLGPAGFAVREAAASPEGDTLLVEGHPAIVAKTRPSAAGASSRDDTGEWARRGEVPPDRSGVSETGDASGMLRFDLSLSPGEARAFDFICPVLPGRRAAGHAWDGTNPWFQLDLAEFNSVTDGDPQPDPGLAYYRRLSADGLFRAARGYWADRIGSPGIAVPDRRWAEAVNAIAGHLALCLNDGEPDLAVVNLNPFTRDGVVMADFLMKMGHFDLARICLDYFLRRPFSGRVEPEADSPGQVLWALGEEWRLVGDAARLEAVYPTARRLAETIRRIRTTPGPHWVVDGSLDYGNSLPEGRRELKPGACDGFHPEFTEAFDIAGLRAAAMLARARGEVGDADAFASLAGDLHRQYDERFGGDVDRGYGSYAVLWPCRLYPLGEGKARDRFRVTGAMRSDGWRYFPLATAHQGLLAGSREAGHGTLDLHFAEEQMRGWCLLDEGGPSGAGGWPKLRSTWSASTPKPDWAPLSATAMPDGWGLAELGLLLRDSLLFEDGDRLVLLAGVSPAWLDGEEPIEARGLPTWFGPCSFRWERTEGGAMLRLTGVASPPDGFLLRLPGEWRNARVTVEERRNARVEAESGGAGGSVVVPPVRGAGSVDWRLPPAARTVWVERAKR